jgi:predicted SprT family Zn-dependent metalloprotease
MSRETTKISKSTGPHSLVSLRRSLSLWAGVWNLPGLEVRTKVVFSSRLRRALGNCDVLKCIIRLNPVLKTEARPKLLEALCHEAAHIAVYERFGTGRRPHGMEWQQFVRTVGFTPKVAVRSDGESRTHNLRTEEGVIYEHRCPVCQTSRSARRPVRRWRCAACAEAGLEGRMVISKRSPKGRAGA